MILNYTSIDAGGGCSRCQRDGSGHSAGGLSVRLHQLIQRSVVMLSSAASPSVCTTYTLVVDIFNINDFIMSWNECTIF